MSKSLCLSWLVLLGVSLVAYSGVMANGYVWDDLFFLSGNVTLEGLSQVWGIVKEPLFGQRAYFRPLPLFMIYSEALVSSKDPALSHAVNLAVHLINCSLLLLLLRRAMVDVGAEKARAWVIPLLLALVYAVHPAQSEAVIWISSRFDLMATFFMLLALWLWGMDRLSTPARAVLVSAAFLAGALCKESLVALPVVLVAYQLLRDAIRTGSSRFDLSGLASLRHVSVSLGICAAGAVYLILRDRALAGADILPVREFPWQLRLLLPLLAAGQYIKLTLVPFFGLSPHHSFYWDDPAALVSYLPWVLIASVIIALAIAGLYRRKLYALAIIAWLSALFPVLHVLPLSVGDNLVHERFMYFPLAVLLLMGGYLMAQWRVARSMARPLAAGLVVFVCASTILVRSIVPVWHDNVTLWEWATRADPHSREAKFNLLWAYIDQQRYDEAVERYGELEQSGVPIGATVYINMGVAFYNMGRFSDASRMYEKALLARSTLPPSYRANLYASMAVVKAILGHDVEARGFIGLALAEKVVTVNAVGNYLAFCKGKIAEPGKFSEAQYQSAEGVMRYVTSRLIENQPEKYERGYFCPDEMGMPVPMR